MIELIEAANAGVISDAPRVTSLGMNVLNFLLSVAGIIAIIALVIAGIKYFLAFGDEKQMQSAKNAAKAAVIGIILAMSGMILVKFIGQFFSS